MSTSEKLERLSTEEPEQPRMVFSDYQTSRLAAGSEDSDSDDGGGCGGGGQTQNAEDATSSKATPVAAVSSSYKRSLSRAYSSDLLPLVKERPQPRTALLVRRPGMWVLRKRQP